MSRKNTLKSDKYRKARGGYSRLLGIACEECGSEVLQYQKDGPGMLKRLYLDRILEPEKLKGLQHMPVKKIPNLACPKCKTVLGVPYTYKKEKRPAFRMFTGSIIKKVKKV